MPTVRRYEQRDKDAVKRICLETAGQRFKSDLPLLYTLYCDYYIEKEPNHCFVLTNMQDEAVGYVICAYDYNTYYSEFKRTYMPRLTKKQARERRAEHLFTRLLTKKYPAHLHIDILPEYCGGGGGKALVKALIDDLRKEGVRGLMLCTSPKNERAKAFFSSCGFTEKRNAIYVMAL